MSLKCEVLELALQPALSVRVRTPVKNLPNELGKGYGAIMQYLAGLNEQPAGPPYAIYYNQDMEDLDVEIGFPVSRRIEGKDNIRASEAPSGKVASCIHTGPYSELGRTYTALGQWVEENGYSATGVAYEIYLDDPQLTPHQELKTQIAYPLR